jgi:hypothetical protein
MEFVHEAERAIMLEIHEKNHMASLEFLVVVRNLVLLKVKPLGVAAESSLFAVAEHTNAALS